MPMSQKLASSPIQYRGDLVDVQTGFTQCLDGFISTCILPYAKTLTCDFVWNQFDLTSAYVPVNSDVVDKSRVHEAPNLQSILQAASLEDSGLDVPITWCNKQAAAAQCGGIPDDIEVQELVRLTSLVKLNQEIKTLAIVLDPTKYTANTGVGGNALDANNGNLIDLATINGGGHQFNSLTLPYDPLILINSLVGSSPFPINWMATSKKIMAYLRIHPAFISNGSLTVKQNNQQIATDLGLSGICEGQSFSAVAGVKTPLFGNFILLFSKADGFTSVDCKVPTFGFTAKMPENGSLDEMYVANYTSWAHGLKGTDFLRTGEQIKPIVASYLLAILIQNVLV